MQEPNTMDQLTEEARALFPAAQETHAERREAQTYTPGAHLPLEEAGRRTGLSPNRLRYHDAVEVWNMRRLSSGTPVGDTPGGTSTTSSSSAA